MTAITGVAAATTYYGVTAVAGGIVFGNPLAFFSGLAVLGALGAGFGILRHEALKERDSDAKPRPC